MKIYLSGDHAGFKLKEKIKSWLRNEYGKNFYNSPGWAGGLRDNSRKNSSIEIEDFGPLEYNEKDDYPDFVIPMAREIVKNKNSKGIIIAGSGQGESIATNKLKGIRAGLYHGGSTKIVKTGRAHDNINILCLGSRFASEKEAKKAIKSFLETPFNKGRHSRRLNKLKHLGSK
ncbi:ribose-5-phosphate isomerase [Candidatus Pacearchaeota archaeon]|nr:ribose-5-phosphate isomerase [Candidatus Pacearchaeota archaeon]